jgi:hypothetical protein
MLGFLVPTGLAAWLLGGGSPMTSGWGSREGRSGVVALGIQILVIASSIFLLYWVFLTGDSGARTIWG